MRPFLVFPGFFALGVSAALMCGCGEGSTSALRDGTSAPPATNLARALAASEFRVDFSLTSDWGSGFGAAMDVVNTGTVGLSDWTLEFDFPYSIDSLWNARIVSHVGSHYVLAPEAWNRALPAGGKVSLGFNGSPGRVSSRPANYLVTTGAAAPTASPGPTASPVVSGGVRYVTDSDWGSGFTGHIEVSGPLQDWVVDFDWDRQITAVWNGSILSHQGTHYRLRAADYNRQVASGANASVGFQGTPGAGGGPSNVKLSSLSGAPVPVPTVTPAPPAPAPGAAGWLHTEGGRIVDANGQAVRLTGLNWFGLETFDFAPHGLWSRNLDAMVAQMAQLGYNCIRLPFSNQLFDASSGAPNIDYGLNPDLRGKRGLEILDAVIASAGAHKMKVILDRHRPDAGGQSELWYTGQYSEERWISDWEMLARRYRNNPTVVGFDLHNEPHGAASWGDGNPATDWRAAATRAGNRILAIHPDLLIVVEGVEVYKGDKYWWGGNLMGAAQSPVQLSKPGRLVYSPHDYPATVFAQPWFSAANYPANLDGVWDQHWGYLARTGQAPVLVGEFGSKYQTASDKAWMERIVPYLGNLGLSFTYWSWNPNSGDTGGILKDDWQTVNADKQAVLQPWLAP